MAENAGSAITQAMDRQSDELIPGLMINDRYVIRRILGRGGFGCVYLAHDEEIERDVAIKVLELGWLASRAMDVDTLLLRFRQEATIAGKIRHPGVVEVYDVGILREHENNPYMIMELLVGTDLEGVLDETGPMSAQRFLPLFSDVLDGLSQVHAMGVVHKDLKPSNLFLSHAGTPQERLKIVDFGTARILEGAQSRLTRTGKALGTPQYMAPEYYESGEVTPAVDVYQMGLILVEMLGGQPAVTGESPVKCVLAHVQGLVTVPAGLLASPLGPILRRALHLDPAQRYANAGEFAEALAEVDPARVAASLTDPRHFELAPLTLSDEDLGQALGTAALPAVAGPVAPGALSPKVVLGLLSAVVVFALLTALVLIVLIFSATRADSSAFGARVNSAAVERDQIQIHSVPQGAVIFRDGRRLGEAPVSVPMNGRGETRLKLVARHPDHEDAHVELRARAGVDLLIKLSPE